MGLTAGNIITEAMKSRGVIDPDETPGNAEMEHNRSRLNRLLDLWSVKKLSIFALTEDTKTLTSGDGEYSIGAAGDIATTRPVTIDHAYLTDPDDTDIDYKVDCTMSEAEYNAIVDKSISARPTRLFYKKSVENGTIKFNYLPDKAYELHLFSVKPFTGFADLTTEYAFPPGYQAALTANLAVVLDYPSAPVDGKLLAEAKETLDAIRSINAVVPSLSFGLVPGAARGNYNVYTDE